MAPSASGGRQSEPRPTQRPAHRTRRVMHGRWIANERVVNLPFLGFGKLPREGRGGQRSGAPLQASEGSGAQGRPAEVCQLWGDCARDEGGGEPEATEAARATTAHLEDEVVERIADLGVLADVGVGEVVCARRRGKTAPQPGPLVGRPRRVRVRASAVARREARAHRSWRGAPSSP